jgi:hypothetical protein
MLVVVEQVDFLQASLHTLPKAAVAAVLHGLETCLEQVNPTILLLLAEAAVAVLDLVLAIVADPEAAAAQTV